jgi:glutamate synthase (ferredoxin)
LIEEHVRRTNSPRGIKLLYQFDDVKNMFVKVIPSEYRQIMERAQSLEAAGLNSTDAVEQAFEDMRKES